MPTFPHPALEPGAPAEINKLDFQIDPSLRMTSKAENRSIAT